MLNYDQKFVHLYPQEKKVFTKRGKHCVGDKMKFYDNASLNSYFRLIFLMLKEKYPSYYTQGHPFLLL